MLSRIMSGLYRGPKLAIGKDLRPDGMPTRQARGGDVGYTQANWYVQPEGFFPAEAGFRLLCRSRALTMRPLVMRPLSPKSSLGESGMTKGAGIAGRTMGEDAEFPAPPPPFARDGKEKGAF